MGFSFISFTNISLDPPHHLSDAGEERSSNKPQVLFKIIKHKKVVIIGVKLLRVSMINQGVISLVPALQASVKHHQQDKLVEFDYLLLFKYHLCNNRDS